MKQLFFEIRKIGLSKLTVAIILCLLLLSAGLAYRQASGAPESEQTIGYTRIVSSVALTALFFGATLVAMLPAGEFSGLGEYVQSFRAFIVAPYAMRTWQAVLLLFAVLVYAANALLDGRTYLNSDVAFDHCNLVAASDAATLFSKYQCVRVLGRPIPVLIAILVLYTTLALVCMGAVVLLHQRFVSIRLGGRERRARHGGVRVRNGSALLGWEFKKIAKNRVVVLAVVLLLAVAAVSGVFAYKEYTGKSDQLYYDYVQTLAPLGDMQRWEYLNAEAERISQAYENYYEYRAAMSSMQEFEGDVVQIENEYYYACLHEQPLARVSEACAYQSERGLDGLTLLYDTGWLTLFESGDSILLFLAILLIATFLAAIEYSSGFSGILPTTAIYEKTRRQCKWFCNFTLVEFLQYISTLKDLGGDLPKLQQSEYIKAQIDDVLQAVELSDVATRRIGTLSGGMKQRLALAQAVLGDPEILILDEPTAGLDPKQRIAVRNFISRISQDKIVIIATHVVSDIEYIAREAIMLKKGVILDSGSPYELTHKIEGQVWQTVVKPEEVRTVQEKFRVVNIQNGEQGAILRILSDVNPTEDSIAVVPSLEDYYLYIFGDIL